ADEAGPDGVDDAPGPGHGDDAEALSLIVESSERREAAAAIRRPGDARRLEAVADGRVPADVDPAAEGAAGTVVHRDRLLVVEVGVAVGVNGHRGAPDRAAILG